MFKLSKKGNKGQFKKRNEVCETNYEAFDLLANRIGDNLVHIENELQKAIENETSVNKSAFSMYIGILINLKNTLDYELTRYGSTGSENNMEVYKTLEDFVSDSRVFITNDNFDFDKNSLSVMINNTQSISADEIKRYIFNSLGNQNELF